MSGTPRSLQTTCLCALMVIAACSDRTANDPVASSVQAAKAELATEQPSAAIEDAPAESSLAIKRGIVTAAGDHGIFRSCDDKAELWLIDEADGTITQMLTEDPASTVFYVEAYGERDAVPDKLTAAKGQAGVFTLEQLLFASPASEGRGCEQAAADYVVSARGNEPFWSLTVTGAGMQWKQPDTPEGVTFSDLQSENAEGTVSYVASAENRKLQLTIDAQPCRDSMSGDYFAFTANAALDGKEFKGCARVGLQEAP
jgi:uncharacterized membrane protein